MKNSEEINDFRLIKMKKSSIRDLDSTGAALIIVLVIMSVMMAMTIAFLTSMRLELKTASSFENTQAAKMLAQSAVSHGIELLRSNIPEPARLSENSVKAPAELWLTNPGRLTVVLGGGRVKFIDLHTGAVLQSPTEEPTVDALSVDLNRPLAGEAFPPICIGEDDDGNPNPLEVPELRVLWKNILEDPSAAPSENNKLIGRYAFWMDDESGKLNYNVAAGKPSPTEVDSKPRFHDQLESGLLTPTFGLGSSATRFNAKGSSDQREWVLGNPRSINLDVLNRSDKEKDVDIVALMENSWLHGFSQFPEAIQSFLNVQNQTEWYQERKFNLTFYSRSPEFNVFGRSRYFVTNKPNSLEGGPNYQLPFIYGESARTGVLHFNCLFGNYKGSEEGAAEFIRAEVKSLANYMKRDWPGYGSYLNKYSEKEIYQIALNFVHMSMMGTTNVRTARNFSVSKNRSNPKKDEIEGQFYPEKLFWSFRDFGLNEDGFLMAQGPGPHVTEIKFTFELKPVGGENPNEYYLFFRHESELYMHPFGGNATVRYYPVLLDYLHLKPSGGNPETEIGNRDLEDSDGSDIDWAHDETTRKLAAPAGGSRKRTKIKSSRITADNPPERHIFSSARELAIPLDPHNFIPTNAKEYPDHAQTYIVTPGEALDIDFEVRLGVGASKESNGFAMSEFVRQMIPLGVSNSSGDVLEGRVKLIPGSSDIASVSYFIQDPRMSHSKQAWIADPSGSDTLGESNLSEPSEESDQKSKFRYLNMTSSGSIKPKDGRSLLLNRSHSSYDSDFRLGSPGYYSLVHTGMQSGAPWRSLSLEPGQASPPDYLLLDLFGSTFPMQAAQWEIDQTLPDQFSTISFMASTAGQVNLNTRVFPKSEWFTAPERRKPLEGVFRHLRDDQKIKTFVSNIHSFQKEDRPFYYVGELSEVNGYTGGLKTQFERESLLRNMYGSLTTRSNTFGLWGVSQVVTKSRPQGEERPGKEWGSFLPGDAVRSERRFYALIERYIWPGRDGVPGNGYTNAQGRLDRIATQLKESFSSTGENEDGETLDRLFGLPGSPPTKVDIGGFSTTQSINTEGTYPILDGPEKVTMDGISASKMGKIDYQKSTLEEAYNPPQPVIKYRVVYFKYLDS